MRLLCYVVVILLTFLSTNVFPIFANTSNISSDPIHAEKFSFYCGPYIKSFEAGKHYIPNDTTCLYSVPTSIQSPKLVALYKGTPGNAVWVGGDYVVHEGTLLSQTPNNYGGNPQDGNNFFAAIFPYIDPEQPQIYRDYFENGAPLPSGVEPNRDYYILPWKWGSKPVEEFDPVVIIPGILSSWEKDNEWVLDPITHAYDNLVDTLLANGYIENQTLFKFPYDWRQSNVITAGLLEAKIEEIKETCDCSQIDIVAHSMGGLVTSQYLIDNAPNKDIDQMIFLGVPMAGAPKAYKTWEAGEVDFGDEQTNIVIRRVFDREARDFGFNSILDYVRARVLSVQELLPIYSYLRMGTTTLFYPAGYPQNTFLEELESHFGDIYNYARAYTVVGNTGNASTTIRYTVTPSTALPKWEHGEPVSTTFGKGDNTVPEFSAIYYFGPEKEFLGIDHTQLVSTSSGYVFETLNSKVPEIVIDEEYDFLDIDFSLLISKLSPSSGDFRALLDTLIDLLPLNQTATTASKILLIVLFSPIDIEITAPDGKRIGKEASTGMTLNEIPNALYSGPTAEHEFVIILDPLPGEYGVKTKGTGSGSYTIATGYSSVATSSASFVSGTTTLNQIIENTMFLSPTTTTVVIEEDIPTPTVEQITPETCVKDMQTAYQNNWIKNKRVYTALVADCKALGILFAARDKATSALVRKNITTTIKLTLAHMDILAKDKGNTKEAVQLITKNTTWFREHKL